MPRAPRRIRITSYVTCIIWWGLSAVFVLGALSSDPGQKPDPQDIGPALIFLWAGGWAYFLRAALNRRVVMLDDGLLWAATLAGPRRVNIYDIRTVDARSLIGKGSDLQVMILKDGDGRRLWLTERMLDTYMDPVQQQTEAHTADVTPRASQIFGLGAPVPRQARIVLGAITAAWYVGTMIGLSQVLVIAQKFVSF